MRLYSKKRGRPKGSPNRKGNYPAVQVRDQRLTIRCSSGFKKFLEMSAERSHRSQSDILAKALIEYMRGTAYYLQPDEWEELWTI